MKDLRATGERRTVSIEVEAPPEDVYAFVTSVEKLGALGPECERCEWVEPGVHFRGHNRVGDFTWSTDCFVVADEPGRRFAYEVGEPRYVRWTYELAPAASGTRLAHSFEILHLSPIYEHVPVDHLPMRWAALEDGMRAVLAGVKREVEAARDAQPA
ncbi:MAG TPA: SRPBCC family protein [Egibacteraceae bacterium]|nr:SRPBCC family protein [Egibacteraceae bacterium]